MTGPAEPILETSAVDAQLPAGTAPPSLEPTPQVQALPLRFTGTGAEYFRIWVVNLLLTIVTLGIYSAWAKVRKTRFFWSNTQLDGASFQYLGNPAAILRGRILAGVIVVTYSVLGRMSITAGLVALTVLGLAAPWFFYKAMRFKLTNTTWRGLRFGFASTVGEAYAALLPAVVVWALFTGLASTVRPGPTPNVVPMLLAELLFFVLLPWFHARIKRYQHRATRCGSLRFDFEPSTGAFYGVYLKSSLLAAVPAIGGAVLIALLASISWSRGRGPPEEPWLVPVAMLMVFVPTYLVGGGYFFARLQQVIWSRTHGGHVRFATAITARRFIGLVFRNGALTVLTLGLYWPFAAVNLARYLIESLSLRTAAPLADISAATELVEPSATGEGAVDFFGWDVGL